MPTKSLLSNQNNLTDYITDRLANTGGAAEGSTLLPRQRGQGRIPIVTGLKVTTVNNYLGGSEFTLVWNNPQTSASLVSGFNVYVVNALGNNQSPTQVAQVDASPAKVRVVGSQASVLTFYVQTVLSSGAVSSLDNSPTCTAQVTAPVISTSDIHVSASSIEPGGANQLIGTNPAGTAGEWKTLSGTANQITVTPGSGSMNLSFPSQLNITAFALATTHVSSATTLANTNTTIFADATSASFNLTSCPAPLNGQLLILRRIDSAAGNSVSLIAHAGHSVETNTIAAGKSLWFQYDPTGTIWRIIAAF